MNTSRYVTSRYFRKLVQGNSRLLKLSIFIFFHLGSVGIVCGADPIVIVVLGPPGSGKGTFSQFLKQNYKYAHLSAGDIVRREIENKTPIGLQIANIVEKGRYIDTQVMRELLTHKVYEAKNDNVSFIIDGFGRTDEEIQFLYNLLLQLNFISKTFVLFFDTNDALCEERMSNRIVCSQCEHIYNMSTAVPVIKGICDICSGRIKQRINDTPEIIKKKVHEYREKIEPNYKKSLLFFPYLFYCTDSDLDICMQFYKKLGAKISDFQGNSAELVDVLRNN